VYLLKKHSLIQIEKMPLTNTWKKSLPKSLVFIDSNLKEYQFLADGVHQNAEVIILDIARNGIEQINEAIQNFASRQGLIEAIQIFSHGSPGSLQLGNSFLNSDNLESYRQILSSWKNALTNKANILLYGCQVAADTGAEFVGKLQQIIGVNIAASVNLTGSSKLGGNWDLEFTTGEILVPIALTEIAQENYPGVLATLTVTNSNDGGAGSLREAIATAETGDTIIFDSSLANQTITLTSGQLDIDKDLIVDGSDAAGLTISGNNASRIFETGFQTNVTLRNLTIANGKTTQSGEAGAGGAIKTGNESTLAVENSEFNSNVAGGEGGGAIFAGFQGNTTVINSKFDNNDGTPDNSERGGGAIATKSAGTLTVRNSEFTNNKGINGGAINHLLGNLTVENSTFLNNEATAQSSNTGIFGLGGAIATDGANASGPDFGPGSIGGEIIVRGSYFEGNRALNGGGANLFAYQADKVIVEDSSFVANIAINTSAGGGNGGGIRHDNSEFTITNTTFSENVADVQGGGLWVDDSSPTTITNSTFSGNRVGDEAAKDGLGGGMTIFSQAEIINSTFADNFSGGHSAAMFVGDRQQITVANTIFDNNTIGESFAELENTNRQLIDGGNNLQSPPVQTVNNLDDAKVTANITVANPQLGELQEINGALVRPLLAGSPAIDAGTNSGAPTTDQRDQQRPVDGDGNGSQITDIGAYEFVNETLPSTVVTNANDGGAGSLREAIATAETGDTIIFDSSLANQTITLTSGQLEIDKDLIIDGGNAAGLTISGNNASRIFDVGFQKSFTLKNLIIANGKTTESGIEGNGGAIKTSSQVTLTVENSEFLNNVTSGEGGGAVAAGSRSNTTIFNSKFDGNDATIGQSERGGGAVISNGLGVMTIRNSEFTNNKGINGGAINTPSTALTVENSTFINNDTTAGASIASSSSSPRGFGGAIYTDGVSASFGGDNGSIIIRDSLFDGNKGVGSGGAAFLFTYPGDNVVIEDTRVLNNSVVFNNLEQAYGGGIRVGTGESSINRTTPVQYDIINTTFAGNTAESQGGGLWIDRKLDLTRVDIVNSTFSENKAENPDGTVGLGGAIATFAPTTITNTTIANNSAAQLSGAIYTTETTGLTPDIAVSNTIFHSNTAGNENGTDQQTNIQLIDGGGNLQFPVVENNGEVLATANTTIADPRLGELQEINGALVRPLVAGSPAIDAGTNTGAPTTDQRGQQRPIDGDGNGSQITDVGAYEFVDNTVPENNPPTVANNRTLTLNEGATSTITTNRLQVTDADDDPIAFNINELPNNGTLKLNNTNLTVRDTFSQTDIDSGNVSYSHNGSETTRDSFSLSASDGNGGNTGNIDVNVRVNAVNDRPSNINLSNNTIAENSPRGSLVAGLSTVDADAGDTHTYTLVDDAGGRFGIEGDRLLVADGSKLDFETDRRHSITITTTDSGTPSKSLRKSFTIGVSDVEEVPPGLNLQGTENGDRLVGGPNRDTLAGAGGSDTLIGGQDNDVLDGGTGQDVLRGGLGNDLYLVDNSDDLILERPNEGKDTVRSTVTYRLPDNLERLVLVGRNNIDGTGNSQDNAIAGNNANNKLVGAAGNDTIWGVGGRDTLIGSRGHDILLGGQGNDLLEGRLGRDRLNGGAGDDTLVGGAGIDTFIFNTNQEYRQEDLGTDVIADFNKVHGDRILLDRRTFTAITSDKGRGFSTDSEFEVVDSNAAAAGSDAFIVYNQTNGNLFYNPNGSKNGLGSGGLFATLTDAPALAESDFLIR
jgi:Ca2+-binding RTX toxin-like protein